MNRGAMLLLAVLMFAPSLDAQLEMGKEVPDFEYTRLDGKRCRLSDHRGRIVVLDFFSVWWLASLNNIAHLQKMHLQFKKRGVMVLELCRDGMPELQEFVATRPGDMTYTTGVSEEAGRKFRVGYIPHIFIIDPLGRLYWHGEPGGGPFRHDRLRARLERALLDLTDGWPVLLRELAEKDFAGARTRLENASTPCELHEAVTALKNIEEICREFAGIETERRRILDALMAERARELAEAEAAYRDLEKQFQSVIQKVEEGGSLLDRKIAGEYARELEAVADKAGSESLLAESIRHFVEGLGKSYEGDAFLGVQFHSIRDVEGAAVRSVVKGTAAEKCGLRPGDLIRAIDGTPIESRRDVHAVLQKRKPGQKIEIRISREEKPLVLHAVLGRRMH